jgi:hypothetical protein
MIAARAGEAVSKGLAARRHWFGGSAKRRLNRCPRLRHLKTVLTVRPRRLSYLIPGRKRQCQTSS